MSTIPWSIIRHFTEAGWYHGRALDSPRDYPVDHPATKILREFGGLKVGRAQPGAECAAMPIELHPHDDPEKEVLELEACLGTSLLGIGSDGNGSYYYSDELGRIYLFEIVAGSVWFQGWSFGEAAESLILGKRSYPLLLPSQPSVGFYGVELYPGNERIFPLDRLKSVPAVETRSNNASDCR